MKIALEQAWRCIDERVTALSPVVMPLTAAIGRNLYKNQYAAISQPPFPRSPLDGYALKAADSIGAAPETPRILHVIGKSFPGNSGKQSICSGEAVRIMTGAPIPEGADCIIRQEDTDLGDVVVRIYASLKPYDNYCLVGEDYTKGMLLAQKGMRVSAGVCAVLASAGISNVQVSNLPRVAIISTGSELQCTGAPLTSGKIYDANYAYLQGRLLEMGIYWIAHQQIEDDRAALERAFYTALEKNDFVISTGGVSVGESDLVPLALEAVGGNIQFRGIQMKPGTPSAFYIVNDKPVLALSGNPFACAVGFELLGRRILADMTGGACKDPCAEHGTLESAYIKPRPVRRFCCGVLENHRVQLANWQKSSQTRMLSSMNCIVELPAGDRILQAGTEVSVYRL